MKDQLNWSLYQESKYLVEENGKMIALQISSKIESLYGIFQLLQGSHLDGFPLKTLKLGWVSVTFLLVTFYLKCLDF